MPGEENATDAEEGGDEHVSPPAHWLAVESRVLGRHDAGCDQEADTSVIDAGKALEKCLMRDGVHGVPDGAADEALARREEEDGGDEYVGFGGSAKVCAGGVEVECEGEHHDEAEKVRPDVDELVVDAYDGAHARPFALREAVAFEDVWVDAPRLGEIVVVNEPVFFGAGEGALNAVLNGEFDRLARTSGFVKTAVNDSFGDFEALVHLAQTSLVELLRIYADCAVLEGIGTGLEFGQVRVHEYDSFENLFTERFPLLQCVLVAALECLDKDGSAPPACFECAIRYLGARVADINEGRPGVFDTCIVLETAVRFKKVQSAIEVC